MFLVPDKVGLLLGSHGAIDHGLQLTVLASSEIRFFLGIVFKLGIIGLNPTFTH